MARSTKLVVNGGEHTLNVDGARSLLTVLRDDLDLTGAKYGCGEGQCGACTVLVEGKAVRACVTAVRAAAGKPVTTIEGLATGDTLHPLQQAFLDAGAMQCGYCVPGMILAALALLRRNPAPTEDDIVRGLQGNICRCGTYPRVIAAVKQAAAVLAREGRTP